MQLFIGNHERVIGRKAYVKTLSGFVSGRIVEYVYNSQKYLLSMDGGGKCYTQRVYIDLERQ